MRDIERGIIAILQIQVNVHYSVLASARTQHLHCTQALPYSNSRGPKGEGRGGSHALLMSCLHAVTPCASQRSGCVCAHLLDKAEQKKSENTRQLLPQMCLVEISFFTI